MEQSSPRFSYRYYATLRDNEVLNGVAARFSLSMNTTTNDGVARVAGELISGNYFGVIGVGTQIGRPLTPEDDRSPGAHAVAVISDGLWKRSFGADPFVLGREIRINDHPFTIVGVAVKGFTGTDMGAPTDVWVPMMMQREVGRDLLTKASTNWLQIVGRLKSGSNAERAAAELNAYVDRRAQAAQTSAPGTNRRRILLQPGDKGDSAIRRDLGPALKVLLLLTALALLLACVNVASLLIVRSVAREREFAVRLALGARRSRLVRQLLTETLVLATLGGMVGLLIAPWAAGLLVASRPNLGIDASVDMRVIIFGLAAWALTGVFVGQAPILASSRIGLAQVFANHARTGRGAPSRVTVHDFVVTFQIALSLVILIGAGLFVQSLRGLSAIDPGFRADRLLVMAVDPGSAGYDEHPARQFLARRARSRGQDSWRRERIARQDRPYGIRP